jgi:hypothetical protein
VRVTFGNSFTASPQVDTIACVHFGHHPHLTTLRLDVTDRTLNLKAASIYFGATMAPDGAVWVGFAQECPFGRPVPDNPN